MYNILICDDEADIRSALKIYLSMEDYRIFEAENGLQALEMIENNDIHLLLMDVMMPVMNGIDALSKLREQNNNIPVILHTAKSQDSDKVNGLNKGADDYIIKPFEAKEVIARIHAVLRRTSPPAKSEKQKEINWDKLSINLTNYELRINGNLVDAPPKETTLQVTQTRCSPVTSSLTRFGALITTVTAEQLMYILKD